MSTDGFDRLYNLMPAVYRMRDAAQGGPLRALVGLIEQQYAVIEQDISGLYENWFIETCDEWVVPYIGDLLGVRALNPTSPGTSSARAYIAHTLDYRRRKGTAGVIEELAQDVTGWPAHVVEFFQFIATTQYLNHLRPSNIATVDLRDVAGLQQLGGPFDQAAYTADVRHIADGRGRYNIPNLGIFLWRLEDYLIGPIATDATKPNRQGTARAVASTPDGRYTFDPLGISAPLLNRPQTAASTTTPTTEINLPGLLRREPLYQELEALRQAEVDQQPAPTPVYFGANPVFQVRIGSAAAVAFDQIMVCDVADVSSTDWRRPPATKAYTPSAGGAAVNKPIALSIDPVRGRIAFPTGVTPANVEVSYVYGSSGDIGAGPYDRSSWLTDPVNGPGPFNNTNRWQVAVSQSLQAVPNLVFATLTQAVQAWNTRPPGGDGVIVLLDSRSYHEDVTAANGIVVPDGSRLLIVAADWPALYQPGPPQNNRLDPNNLRPHITGRIEVKGTAPASSQNSGQLFIDGLLVEGGVAVLAGNLSRLSFSHATIPSQSGLSVASSAGGGLDNSALALTLYRALCGPLAASNSVPSVTLTDSIVSSGVPAAANAPALAAPGATLTINTSTLFGTVAGRIVNASDSIFTGTVTAARRQAGCVRFSYLPSGSQTARRYRCQPDLALANVTDAATQSTIVAQLAPQFTSTTFGQPFYAQLGTRCANEIATGADDEAEMGAFNFLQQPQRAANLATALDEYLRFGLEAGTFEQT